ncbi:hypothetical protein SDC9_170075 [bioreactor metagenome]|uniref:Uncharacterized protein n=1 Tax=bioreactor metagenome TaxID=1076179 RepID=A0A645G9P2_9ZZZZ|nr:hypothetical protein [Clostridium sp. UBA4548]
MGHITYKCLITLAAIFIIAIIAFFTSQGKCKKGTKEKDEVLKE